MANTLTDAAQAIRIAIALAALRHKPASQSCEAYVLELQDRFPLEGVPGSQVWRDRALALELRLKELQGRYDTEHIELLSLRDTRPALETVIEHETDSKKKQKKQKQKKSACPAELPTNASAASGSRPKPDLKHVLGGSHSDVSLPCLPSTNNILSAFETLDRLLCLSHGKKPASQFQLSDLLAAVVERAVGALSDAFARLLPPNPAPSSAGDILVALGTLFERLISNALPLFARPNRKQGRKLAAPDDDAILDELLGQIAALLLLPLVRSLAPLSTDYLSALLPPRKNDKRSVAHPPDVRPDVLAVFDRAIAALGGLAIPACGVYRIKHVLMLEAARELQRLYMDNRPLSSANDNGTIRPTSCSDNAFAADRADRLRRLARKDALWYLCHVLQRVLSLGVHPSATQTMSPAGCEQDELLEGTLCGMLSGLLQPSAHCAARPATGKGAQGTDGTPPRRGRPHYEMEEAERGMLLAVVERAWLGL